MKRFPLIPILAFAAAALLMWGDLLPAVPWAWGVSSGPRQILIVHESHSQTPAMSDLVRDLRTGPNHAYLASKSHPEPKILDKETPGAPELAKFGPLNPPELLIIAPPDRVLSRAPLPATADEVIAQLKAQGG